jgi:L-amino acid N-acyltransferase YncA
MSEKPQSPVDSGPEFKLNSTEDLVCFEETERWHDRDEFLAIADERLDAGTISITLVEDRRLAFVAWLAPATEKSTFGYVRQTVHFPPKTATEYGVYVHPEFRRRGLFRQGLEFMSVHAFAETDTDILLGAVHDDNHAALRGHIEAGFQNIATLTERRLAGTARSSVDVHAAGYQCRRMPDSRDAWSLARAADQ